MFDNLRYQRFIFFFGILRIQNTVFCLLDAETTEAFAAAMRIVTVEKMITLVRKVRETRIRKIARCLAFVEVAREGTSRGIHAVLHVDCIVDISTILEIHRAEAVLRIHSVLQIIATTIFYIQVPCASLGTGER